VWKSLVEGVFWMFCVW